MSTVHDIRKGMDTQLDWLEARAAAMEQAITNSREQMQSSFETSKQQAEKAQPAPPQEAAKKGILH